MSVHVEDQVVTAKQVAYKTEKILRKRARRAGRSSKQKGARGEKEFAEVLRQSWGVWAARGHGTDTAHALDGVHFEVKFVEKLDVPGAYRQAVHDAQGRIPILAHRSSRQPWLVTLELAALPMVNGLLKADR